MIMLIFEHRPFSWL